MEEKELREALDNLKNQLEASLTKKSEGQVAQIKAAEDKLEAVEKSLKELEELKAKKPEVTAAEVAEIKANLDATIKAFDILQVRIKNAPEPKKEELKTFDVSLKEAIQEAEDKIAKFNRGELKRFDIELKTVGDVTTANITGGSVWGAQYQPGIIQAPNRKVHMRNILKVLPAGPGTDYYFMRENGAGEGAIAPTAETSTKPQIDIDLVESSVKFETIAGWLRVSRKALNNVQGLTAFLQSRLPEKLLNVEDAQILLGDGNSPNLKGWGTSGNFTASNATASQVLIEKIITDIADLEDVNERDANFGLLRPADYYSFFLNKATGSGEYDLPQGVVFNNGVLYILGVPFYPSTAVKKDSTNGNDYYVGDLNGANIMQQEAMRIEFFEQDGTNVRENKITVRIEETIALPVYGSDYLIKGSTKYTPPAG